MRIVGAIDGTGVDSDSQYKKEFKDSHVNKLSQMGYNSTKYYQRGPTMMGNETNDKGRLLFTQIRAAHSVHGDKLKVFLTGYSRGGAAVIHTAHLLKNANVPVQAMFLFDAVDRTIEEFKTLIPNNVGTCYHAIRNPDSNSRSYFSNCGLRAEPSTRIVYIGAGGIIRAPAKGKVAYMYPITKFMGTHGALGGVPQLKSNDGGAINEMDGDWNEEKITAGGTAKAVMGGPAGIIGYGGKILANRGARVITQTTITPMQNLRASNAVWKWMLAHVRREFAR